MSVFEQLKQGQTPSSSGGVFARLEQETKEKNKAIKMDIFNTAVQSHDKFIADTDRLKQAERQKAVESAKQYADTQTLTGLTRTQPETPPIEKPMLARLNEEQSKARETAPSSGVRSIEEELAYRDAERAKMLPDNAFGQAVRSGYQAIDRFFLENPVGSFLSRVGQSAAGMLGQEPLFETPTTGSKIADTVADVGGALGSVFVNPGGVTSVVPGQASIVGQIYNNPVTQRIAQTAASKVSNPTAQRVVNEAVREGITGAVEGGAMALARGGDERDALVEGAIGGAAGGALGGLMPLVSESVKRIVIKYRPQEITPQTLALPTPRRDQRIKQAEQRRIQEYGSDPIVNEYTFKLPEASPDTSARIKNIQEARNDLKEIENEIRILKSRYEKAINDQYEYLKTSIANRGGVQQGSLLRNQQGEVIGRVGRTSTNPEWYREFYKQNNRKPNRKELYELAKKHVDEGFIEAGYRVPSWKEHNGYDEAVKTLESVRDAIRASIREMDPAINITDSPIKGSIMRTNRGVSIVDNNIVEGNIARPQESPSGGVFESIKENTLVEPTNAQNAREMVENMIESAKVDPDNPLVRDNNVSGIGIVPFAQKARLYDNLSSDTKSQLMTKTRKPETTLNAKIKQSYINTVDDLFSFQNFDKNAEKILGRKLKASEGTYIPAITSRGSDIITKQILTENMVDSKGNVIGKSFKEILKKLPKGKQVDFEDYLVNKHAITRHARGEKVYRDELNWTPEFGARKVAEYEQKYPQFKEMAEEYYQFRYNLAKSWLVDTGLISENVLNKWLDENPFYVPMQRHFDEIEKSRSGLRAKRGFGDQSAPVRKYSKTGSQRLIISPIETTIENVDAMVKASKRNQVMQNLVNIIRRDPEALEGWAELVPEQSAARHTSIKQINEIMEKEGIDGLVNQLNNDFEILFNKSSKKNLDKDNVIRVMMNGEPVHVRINDPQLLDAISGLNPPAQGVLMNAISNTTRVVKLLTTGANPVFSVTRNMFRDIPMAYIASKTTNNPLRFGYDLIEGFVSALSNGKLYQSFKNVGGGHASAVAADRNLLAQSKREIIGNRLPKDYLGSLLGKIENFNNALEAAPRLGEFKRMVKQSDTYENRLRGLFEANDITVNFKRRGKVSPQLDPFILYWNASVQGLDKAIRIFKDNPVAAGVKAFASITVPTLVLYALNHDKKEYQETSEYLKDNYYLIPTGDEKNPFVRIPKPQVLMVPFSNLPERILRMWKDEDPDAFREFATTVVNQFLPAGMSGIVQDTAIEGKLPDPTADTIFGPFSDIRANKNFAGASIVPGYLEGVSPRLQYDSRTSEISKWIGDKLNLSPKQIDHLIKSYTGVLGQLGIPATSEGATVADTLLRQVTVDPVYSNNLMSKFYETKDKLDTMYKDIQQTGVVPKGYHDDLRKFMNRVSDAMSDVRKQMRAVESDKTLTSEQKKETNRELQKMLNNLAREANIIAEQVAR